MAHATFLKRFTAVFVAVALFGMGAPEAHGQDLARVNQDELASFYGRMNVVVGSGARAFGMGGAFLARADDATAASWNPAGLSYLRRTEVSLVGAHNDFLQRIPSVEQIGSVESAITLRDHLGATMADFIGFAYPLRLQGLSGAVQVSYQRSFSFSGTRRVSIEGARPSRGAGIPPVFTVEGQGGFDTISLSSGFEVHRRLRVGLSLNRWVRGFSQNVARTERTIESNWDIGGTNVNFGLLLIPTPKLNFGAVLKTPFDAEVLLEKTRTDTFASDPVTGVTIPPKKNQASGNVRIRFPRVYGLGASYRATNTFTFSADFTSTAWSKATIENFFSLAVEGFQPTDIDRYGKLPFPAVEEAGGQADTSQLRVGAEWVFRPRESGTVLFPIRAGFFRDGQPVIIRLKDANGVSLPGVKPVFTGLTAGLGVTLGGVLLDVAYIHEFGKVPATRRDQGIFDSTRRIRYNRLFASMMVRFGPRR